MNIRTLAALLACWLTACSDNTSSNPVGPTGSEDAGASGRTLSGTGKATPSAENRPQPSIGWPWFDAKFYDELVYTSIDSEAERNPNPDSESWVLENPQRMNILVNRIETTGRCGTFEHTIRTDRHRIPYRHLIWRETRDLFQQATGLTWRGTVSSSADPARVERARRTLDWIVVDFERYNPDDPPPGEGIAWAAIGANPGNITFLLSTSCGLSFNGSGEDFRHVYAHELGHALGFWHVRKNGSVMHPGDYASPVFTDTERQHMQLAYRAGRDHRRGGGGYPLLTYPGPRGPQSEAASTFRRGPIIYD